MMDGSNGLVGDDVDTALSSDSDLLPETCGLLDGTLSVIRLGAGDDSFALWDVVDALACPDTGLLILGGGFLAAEADGSDAERTISSTAFTQIFFDNAGDDRMTA
ncbi:hypothetical protein GCM10011415_25580 [Salipiger pallidus]|uniref:Uncharacterized protein n=1 Tax=Salipiger pallidus TaxID=1775170 RepID=A0A8J2ZKZ7_9RHOB|nr:hypothetical protein [Salipiger pallidus]GGG75828.1 hypothetical protein GCM10011415_25580 [Salipiger pallidus]